MRDRDQRRDREETGDHQQQGHPWDGMQSIRRERQRPHHHDEGAHVGIRSGDERGSQGHSGGQGHRGHGSDDRQQHGSQQHGTQQHGGQHQRGHHHSGHHESGQQGSQHRSGQQQGGQQHSGQHHGGQQQNAGHGQHGGQHRSRHHEGVHHTSQQGGHRGGGQHGGQHQSQQRQGGAPDPDRYHQSAREGRSAERTSAGVDARSDSRRGRVGGDLRGEHDAGHDASAAGQAEQFSTTPGTRDERGHVSDRAHGGRRNVGSSGGTANPQSGSQRGERSDQGPAGHVGGQYGKLHGSSRSDAEAAGFHDDERYAGGSMSSQDHRFGSRRGHGTRRQPTFTRD